MALDLLDDEIGGGLFDRTFGGEVFSPRILMRITIRSLATDGYRNSVAPRDVQHFCRNRRSRGSIAMCNRHPQQVKILMRENERQRPCVVNVIANIRVENHLGGRGLIEITGGSE